jgi:MYND finger
MRSLASFENVRRDIRNKPNVPLQKIRDIGGFAFDNRACLGCGKQSTVQCPVKFVRCSRCKAANYCGKACQIADFKGQGKGATQPRSHKELCPEFIEMNAEFENHPLAGPTFLRTELFKSWANQHNADGSFFTDEFLARRNLLGGAKVGFWAQPEPSAGGPFATDKCCWKDPFPSWPRGGRLLSKQTSILIRVHPKSLFPKTDYWDGKTI